MGVGNSEVRVKKSRTMCRDSYSIFDSKQTSGEGKRRDAVQGHADDQLSDVFAQCEIIAYCSNVRSFIPSVHIFAIYFVDVRTIFLSA